MTSVSTIIILISALFGLTGSLSEKLNAIKFIYVYFEFFRTTCITYYCCQNFHSPEINHIDMKTGSDIYYIFFLIWLQLFVTAHLQSNLLVNFDKKKAQYTRCIESTETKIAECNLMVFANCLLLIRKSGQTVCRLHLLLPIYVKGNKKNKKIRWKTGLCVCVCVFFELILLLQLDIMIT